MSEVELTPEERKHLYNTVSAVFLIAFFSFLVPMLFYLMPPKPFPQGMWDFFVWYGVPLSIIVPASFFLPYEVFYPKRARKSRMFHTKRFARRTVSLVTVMLGFFWVTSLSVVTFSQTLGDNAFMPGMVTFVLVFLAAALLWLRRQSSRIQRFSETM